MPYAVIETGGKQYKVEAGQKLQVERLAAEAGKPFAFDKVLLVVAGEGKDPAVGLPYLKGATVAAEVLGEIRGPKVVNFRFKRRKNYRRKKGHRQIYTEVKILEIHHGA
jgi:large subunit ribosomal protein L21